MTLALRMTSLQLSSLCVHARKDFVFVLERASGNMSLS